MNYRQIPYTNIYNEAVNRFGSSHMSRKRFATAGVCVSHYLGEPKSQVEQFLYGFNPPSIQLFKSLAKKYNLRNAELPLAKREGKEDLFGIVELVKRITPNHFNIIQRTKDGFDSIKKIFSLAQDNESLDFVSKLQQDVLYDQPNQSNIIIGILNSKHKSLFMDNIEQFKSYFKLNSNDTKAMTELEQILDNKCFSQKKFDSEIAIKMLMQFKNVRDYADSIRSDLTKYYTPESARFLWSFTNRFLYNKIKPQNVDKRDILDLYKSSNADNIKLRLDIIDKFGYCPAEKFENEVKELKKLFKNAEQNEDVKEFVTNAVKKGLAVNSIGELNSVIEATPLKKANYFFDNVRRIVALSEGEERTVALKKETENPFFIPNQKRTSRILNRTGIVNEYGYFGKISSYLKNRIKVFLYNNFMSNAETLVITTKHPKPKLKFQNNITQKNIQLTKEVNDIIKSKLGKRTYTEQEDTYRLKATKIRLGILPEIFDSIKATRAQNRKQGIEPNISNKDASRLYELINGTNRKTIRYMLKISDKNGNRIFDVKQITELIEGINRFIREEKAIKPNYRAADTKAYYENIFNDLNAKYGKLKRTNKNQHLN